MRGPDVFYARRERGSRARVAGENAVSVLERRGVRGRRGEVRGRWSSFATIRVVFVDSKVGAKRSIDRRLNRVRREAERQWNAERGKLRKEMERHRASALKAKRELDMVKRLRDAERDELRATRIRPDLVRSRSQSVEPPPTEHACRNCSAR